MPFALALSDARDDLIALASIDGKTGANARHTTARLNRILNRKYRALRSRVSWAGLPHFVVSTGPLTMPAIATNEDFIELPMPAATEEVVGVDVRTGSGDSWSMLDPLGLEQRRDAEGFAFNDSSGFSSRIIGTQGVISPPHGVGWWTMLRPPVAVQSATITAGAVAITPRTLSGQYQLLSVQGWTDITVDAHVFVLYEGWDEWLLNAACMAICQRDRAKSDVYRAAADAWGIADDLVSKSAGRLQRGGAYEVTPYRGVNL
jgi:hypothetical protein